MGINLNGHKRNPLLNGYFDVILSKGSHSGDSIETTT